MFKIIVLLFKIFKLIYIKIKQDIDIFTHSYDCSCMQLSKGKLRWFRRQLLAWGKLHRRQFPWRESKDPYAILVAEFLLQKTNASLVVPLYKAFIENFPTVTALATAPAPQVTKLLLPLGLSFRGERLHRTAKMLLEKYGGKIPAEESKLRKLPGVGKYIARSVCACAFGQRKAVVDTNVARILERFFGLEGGKVKSRSRVLWEASEQLVPRTRAGDWNLALLDFGATVCTAKKPRCLECPLRQQCEYLAL